MENLILVQEDAQGRQVVGARDLYNFLGVKRDFTNWCKQMFDYGFEEDKDFTPILAKSTGGRPSIDYALTIDTAKEISMIQRSEKGRQARQYFLDCERKLIEQRNSRTLPSADQISPLDVMQMAINQLRIQESRLLAAEDKILELDVRTSTRPDYFTIVGYAVYQKKQVPLSLAKNIGQKAKKLCAEFGYIIDSIPDPRFGKVNQYPRQILELVFKEMSL